VGERKVGEGIVAQSKAKLAEAKPQDRTVIEVVLAKAVNKKHSVRFETDDEDVDFTNIYLKQRGVRALGSPSAIKVTIEAYDQGS
jgi:hypothetical protein